MSTLAMYKLPAYMMIALSLFSHAEAIKLDHGTIHSFDESPGFIYIDNNGEPIVEVIDTNNDGKIDLLRYSVYDENNNEILVVEDHGIDGTLDQRWHRQKPEYFEVQYNGLWHRVHGKGQQMHIKTKSGQIAVDLINGKLSTSPHNKSKQQGPSGGTR